MFQQSVADIFRFRLPPVMEHTLLGLFACIVLTDFCNDFGTDL